MNGFVISDGTAIRLADIIAVHTDGQGRNIVFLTNGLWIEITEKTYRKILTVIWNSRERSF